MQFYHPRVGEPVLHLGQRCHIKAILDIMRCLVQPDDPSARPRPADFHELRPVPEAIPGKNDPLGEDISGIPDEALVVAHRRLEIIRPLLIESTRRRVSEVAQEHGQHTATLYRWMSNYRKSGMVASLIPRYHRRGGPLKSRLEPRLEALVRGAIEECYLTKERPSLAETIREVAARCRKEGFEPPGTFCVRSRVMAISARLVARARIGKKAASRFAPLLGSLPGAEHPWSIVHIDHTKMGIILVDRGTRQPIGRAWITLAEDAATRMIVGFHISLDDPSALAVGLCLAQAMLPKEKWLARHGIEGDWPVWGQPKIVHVDNAEEFRGKVLARACDEMGISIHFRRAGVPRDGGRIERLIGTLERELHRLPGTTFSNPVQRGEYNSEKEAAMTLDELEHFVGEWVVNTYHHRPHRGLNGKAPIKAWEDGLLGGTGSLGMYLPTRQVDEEAVRLRFLPYEMRVVHPAGLVLDDVTYWSDHLRYWIGAKDPTSSRQGRKFLVRRDPRDISRVWFYDPSLREHIEVPYRDVTRPPISLWELREARKNLAKEGVRHVNEEVIFASRERLKQIAEQGVRDTKAARRERERAGRRREGATVARPAAALPAKVAVAPPPPTGPRRSARSLAFDDIEN